MFFTAKFKNCFRSVLFSFIVLHIFSSVALGQFSRDWRSDIDLIIQETDSLSLRSQKTFSLFKPYHHDKDIRENWYYTTKDGRVVIFEVQYVVDSMEFSEIYYLHRGRLICMEHYEAPYLSVYADQLKWGEAYFFLDNSLKQYVLLGKPRPSPGLWNSEVRSYARFQQRFAELQRHMKYLR